MLRSVNYFRPTLPLTLYDVFPASVASPPSKALIVKEYGQDGSQGPGKYTSEGCPLVLSMKIDSQSIHFAFKVILYCSKTHSEMQNSHSPAEIYILVCVCVCIVPIPFCLVKHEC